MIKNSFENLRFRLFIVVHSFIHSFYHWVHFNFQMWQRSKCLDKAKTNQRCLTIYSKLILKDDGTLDFIVYFPTVICPSFNRDSSIMCFAFHSNLQCHKATILNTRRMLVTKHAIVPKH